MSVLTILAVAVAAGTGATAGERPVRREVSICMNPGANASPVFRAQAAASEMFARSGVNLKWRSDPGWCATNQAGIVISLMVRTPTDHHPGELAYATPYEGRTIVVFYDRVQAANVPPLLAHVLVHELTHLLQGVALHSASEMMKARWGHREYNEMRRRALQFSEEDVYLIHRGLAARDGLK